MPESLSVGDIHKSLKAQAEASQKIYEKVVELADIAHDIAHEANTRLGSGLSQRLEKVIRDLSDVADALSDNIEEVTKRVLKSLETTGQSSG